MAIYLDDDDGFDVDQPPMPGVCSACGCTDDEACDGGCVWANGDATLCSRCAGEDDE